MSDYKLEVKWVPIEQIKPYSRNAKKHPAKQVALLAQQISTLGFDQPICVDKDFVIIKGHGRREGAIAAGMKEVPVIVRTDLTEEQCIQARLADNKIAEYGEIDEDMLRFEFGTLARLDMDLTLTGFELGAIEKIMEEPKEKEPPKEKEEKSATQFIVTVHCVDEPQMQEIYGELTRRGLEVKMLT